VKTFGSVAVGSADGVAMLGGAVLMVVLPLVGTVSAGVSDPHAVRINSPATTAAPNGAERELFFPELLKSRYI
jgi:hypothetical protein